MNVDTGSKKLTLDYHAQWKLDVKTGEVVLPQKKRRYEAEHASVGGGAVIADCGSKRGVHQSTFLPSLCFVQVSIDAEQCRVTPRSRFTTSPGLGVVSGYNCITVSPNLLRVKSGCR